MCADGGLLRLAMPREGVVADILVGEGDHVAEGQVMATLDPEPAKLALAAAQAALEQAAARVRAQESRLADLGTRGKRLAEAAAAGAGGQQIAARQKVAGARHELEQQSLHAPLAGEVIRRTIQPGSVIGAQSAPAFILLPDLPRIVRAEVNSAFVGNVHVGMAAQVVEDGSGRQYAAHVVRIGKVFGASDLEEDPQVRSNARSVQCVLAIDSSAPADLLIGQRVQVRFTATANTVTGVHN